MVIKRICYLLLVLISLNSFCQKKVSIDLLTGLGLNQDFSLVNEKIQDYTSFTTQVNINYTFKLYKSLKAETGLGLQWYYSSGNVGLSNFNAKTLRLNIPVLLSYSVLEKLGVSSGIAIGNNRDFDDFNLREENNLRSSLIFKVSYLLESNFSILFKVNQNVSDIPNAHLLNQPNTDLLFGITYKLF